MIKRGHPQYESYIYYLNGRSWDFNIKGEPEPSFMWRVTYSGTGRPAMIFDRSHFGSFKEFQNGIDKQVDNKLSKKGAKLYKITEEY